MWKQKLEIHFKKHCDKTIAVVAVRFIVININNNK